MIRHVAGPFYTKGRKSFHMVSATRESVLRQLKDFSPRIVLWSVQGGAICKRLRQPEPPLLSDSEARKELEKLFGKLDGSEKRCRS